MRIVFKVNESVKFVKTDVVARLDDGNEIKLQTLNEHPPERGPALDDAGRAAIAKYLDGEVPRPKDHEEMIRRFSRGWLEIDVETRRTFLGCVPESE